MYSIIHTIVIGQSGNDGCRHELIKGFNSKEEAQEYINTKCEHNAWHSYKIIQE